MGVLSFDGTDDMLHWGTLASALANVSDGAYTIAVLWKRSSVNSFQPLSYLTSASAIEVGMLIRPFSTDMYMLGVNGEGFMDITDSDTPYITVVTKTAGTTAPRAHWKVGAAGSWTHSDFGSTIADQIDSTQLDIGGSVIDTGDQFGGWIGLVGWWEGSMSDANVEALDNNWRTSDWWASAHGTPVFLAELDVAGASVTDLAGNASGLSVTGTSLDSGETLESWNFDGTGGAAPASLIYNPAKSRAPLRSL